MQKKLLGFVGKITILIDYFDSDLGKEYGVDSKKKVILLIKMKLNTKRIICATNLMEHLAMVIKILSIPKFPGLIGAGSGIGLVPQGNFGGSGIGYIIKSDFKSLKRIYETGVVKGG